MAYDLFIKRRIDEIEERLLTCGDSVERLHTWFSFVKTFSMESHTLYDMQYSELVALSKMYTETPDMVARKALKKQITSCIRELENLGSQMKRVPRIQSRLEQAITSTEGSRGEKI